jgi:MFS family permease
MPSQTTADLARAIQLAVAPVFLLLGISALLGVMANRIGRVIDRVRRLEERDPADEACLQRARDELRVLGRRATLVNRAIALCVISALMVASVIIALFLGVLFREDFPYLVSAVFIGALLALCAALVFLLQEIRLATQHLRIGN